MNPLISKARSIAGQTLRFRDAGVPDAEFILSLRLDEKKNKHLSATSGEVEQQRQWLDSYAKSDGQAYFIIESAGKDVGTVRLYDARGDSFSWGSWIISDDAPARCGIESALMVYRYAVGHLSFSRAHFEVRKLNQSVCAFHERFGAVCVSESESTNYYEIGGDAIAASMKRYERYLSAITVEEYR